MNKQYIINPIKDECLAHHGIKGQKWGVQNEKEPTGKQEKKPNYSDLYEYDEKSQAMKRVDRDEYAKRGVKAAGVGSGILAGVPIAIIGASVVTSMSDVNLGKALGAVGLISAGVGVASGFLGAHVQKKGNQRELARLESQGKAIKEGKVVVERVSY